METDEHVPVGTDEHVPMETDENVQSSPMGPTAASVNSNVVLQVINMLEFLIDNIFVSCGGILFQQVVGIPMGKSFVPLL
jgi:hypothetical protein